MIKEHRAIISILLFYLLLFLPFLGSIHLFDWDEINFAEAAREMIITGDWINIQINYEPFWEKPPLFIWLQALSMKLFGVNEFAARFPNVIIGLVTLIVMYAAVFKRYTKQAAIFTVLLYIGSYTPHFYFKSGIIDPLFNLFIFLSVLSLVQSVEDKKRIHFFLAGLFLGLAIITKGPAALLLVGLAGLFYQLMYKVHFYTFTSLVVLAMGLMVAPGLYFGLQVMESGFWFVKEFVIYQIDLFRYPIASHGQPFYYHAVVLLVGCFPLVILAWNAMFKRIDVSGDTTLIRFMKVLFWVVLIVFSLVTTKIVHYSSMCYIPLASLGGIWVSNYASITKLQRVLFVVVSFVWVLLFGLFGLLYLAPEFVQSFIQQNIADPFVLEQFQTVGEWSAVPIIIALGLIYLVGQLLFRYHKAAVASLLVFNAFFITLFLVSTLPQLEHSLQGKWIDHLKTYQGEDMRHYTYGFKSFAHLYYTQVEESEELAPIQQIILKEMDKESYSDITQFDKQFFDAKVRDYIIEETEIPISISAKIDKFKELESNPYLKNVFKGNGYGVWERSSSLRK